MTLYDKRKNKLINELKDKKYREAYVEESIRVGIPFQIKTLRDQKKWKQKDLEKYSGIKQSRISLLEDPNYLGFSLATLKKLASSFDIGLVVRFVPFGDLVEWELNLSSESMEALSFNEDPYFQEKIEEVNMMAVNEQYVIPPPPEASNKVVYIKDRKSKKTISSTSVRAILSQPLAEGMLA